MSIRVIRNIKLNNVKLIARCGKLKLNLLDKDNDIAISSNGGIIHPITSFSSARYSTTSDTSGNIDNIVKVFKPTMTVQFIEDNGVYKMFFDRNDLCGNSNNLIGPYSRELGIILGTDPAIEEKICEELDSLKSDGATIYSYPSLELTTSDWKGYDTDDLHLLRNSHGVYYNFTVEIDNDIKCVLVNIGSNLSVNVLPDNKLIFNDIDTIVSGLEDINYRRCRESLQDFAKLDLKDYLSQDATKYLTLVETRVNEAITACESAIKYRNDDKVITLDTFLKSGSIMVDRSPEDRHKLWALNNMKYAIKDEVFIEHVLAWMITLNTKSAIDPATLTNGRLYMYGIPKLPNEMIRNNHIVPYLDDINILDYISNFLDTETIISYDDDCDYHYINDNVLINDVSRYVCESMIGVKLDALRICLNSAHYLRSKYSSFNPELDMDQLNELMAKYPGKSIPELCGMHKAKHYYIDMNLDAIDKLISLLSKLIDNNSDRSVVSLIELSYDDSWSVCDLGVFERRSNLLDLLNVLMMGYSDKETMCRGFETSELRTFWRDNVTDAESSKTIFGGRTYGKFSKSNN